MTRFARAAVLSLLAGLLPASAAIAAPAGGRADVIIVYFSDWSGALDHTARDVVARAARRAKRLHSSGLTVAGYADDTGTPESALALTQLRARRVADLLQKDGVPASMITLKAEGAQRTPGVASRRVEITIAGQ